MKNKPRAYAQYWDKIKKNKKLCIEVHETAAKTVRRMIIKEKDEDIAFKLEKTMEGLFYIMKIKEEPGQVEGKKRLTFELVLRSDSDLF